MSLLAPAPQTIAQVLDRGFRLFRSSLRPLLPLMLGIAVLSTLSGIAQPLMYMPHIILLYPLVYALMLALFRDLQTRKSGSDLAARIEPS